MRPEIIWMFVAAPVWALLTGIGTFVIIHLDERPKKKRKR